MKFESEQAARSIARPIHTERRDHRSMHGKLIIRHNAASWGEPWEICRVSESQDPREPAHTVIGRYKSEQAAERAYRQLMLVELPLTEEEDDA